jgi:hypothetical protein
MTRRKSIRDAQEDDELKEALAVLIASTHSKERPLPLTEVAKWLEVAVGKLGSYSAVADRIGLSPQMLRQFSHVPRLAKSVQKLFQTRQLDSVDTATHLAVLPVQEQQVMAEAFASGDIDTSDIQAVAQLRRDGESEPIDKLLKHVRESKTKHEYVAEFLVRGDRDSPRIMDAVSPYLPGSEIIRLELKGDVGRLAVTEKSKQALAGIALRYPEKTFYLGQVFKDTTNSYKLFWFLSILSLFKQSEDLSFRLVDIFTDMAVAAWHPVCLFRLSLGRQDKLQDVILDFQKKSGLPLNVAPEAIRKFVSGSADAQTKLEHFKRFVPTRFLTPWFADKLRGERDDIVRTREIQTMAKESQKTPFASLYYFDDSGASDSIRLNDSWRSFLTENLGIVQSFADYHLALYLQARNPNVPGVVNKLRAPTMRQLTAARDFWWFVRSDFEKAGKAVQFKDIYSEQQLGDSFSIDHFLPWSFVVHDLLWNLTPVEPATNSSKSDILPDLDLYLPRLAKLHFSAIEVARKHPKFLEDYIDCFKQEAESLLSLGENGFAIKYREVIVPQAQIAMNQGFQSGWKIRN